MINSELKRLQKLETRIYQIAEENGLVFGDIEFDIIPQEKMFEMMAYGMPGMFGNWKFGRDYEKTRTIYEKMGVGLPYEVVVNTNPARAYLMKDNVLSLQTLIIAHVVGHVAFFTMNKYHKENDSDIASRLIIASQRYEEYERKYGIDIVEATVDAGHSIMFHSNPSPCTCAGIPFASTQRATQRSVTVSKSHLISSKIAMRSSIPVATHLSLFA